MRLRIFAAVILASLVIAPGCSRGRQPNLEVAEQQQRAGDYALALEAYRTELSRTSRTDNKRLSILNLRIGECLAELDRMSEAFSAYMRAVEYDEHNVTAHMRLGELYLRAGAVDRASEHALAVLRESGTSADALTLVGAAAAANGNFSVARDAYERALALEPGRTKTSIALAEVLDREDQVEMARAVLKKASEAQPMSAAPWLALARLEEQQGRAKEAEAAYRQAVASEDTPESNLRLAQFLQRAGRVSEAEAALLAVDKKRPHFATAAADYHFTTGQYEKAEAAYSAALPGARSSTRDDPQGRAAIIARLIEADMESAGALNGSARAEAIAKARQRVDMYSNELDPVTRNVLKAEVALASEDVAAASIAASSAVEQAPDSPAAHYLAGIVRYRASDFSAAVSEWQKALEKDGGFVPAGLALAREALDRGDIRAAQDYVVPIVRHEPANVHALTIFARVLIGAGAYDSATSIIQRLEAVRPSSPVPSVLRGEMAMARGNFGSALIEYQKAVLLDTSSQEAIDGLTRVYREGHITRPMLLNMERIGKTQPPSPTLLEITGRVFASLKMYEDAQRCLEEAVSIDPSRHTSSEWLARVQAAKGDLEAASKSAGNVRELSPMLAGVEAEQRNDLQKALEQYEAAIRRGDNTGVAANNAAWIYAQQGRELERALQYALRARELQPGSAAVLDTLGYVHLARREYTRAVEVLEEAKRQAANDENGGAVLLAQVKQHLSEAYLRAGHTERASLRDKSGAEVPARKSKGNFR